MKITKDIISDLIPLYFANECSPDTRELVEEYLKENPQQAEEFRKIAEISLPGKLPPAPKLEEIAAFRETRRRLRVRAFLMGRAIFFSLAPLSISNINGQVWWCLRDSPKTALIYATIAVVLWVLYALNRKSSRSL